MNTGKRIRKTICPMCGWHRNVLRKNAPVRVFHFGAVPIDPINFEIIRWVVSHGNSKDPKKKKGFQPLKSVNFVEALKNEEDRKVVIEVYKRAKEIIKVIDQARAMNGERG